jgi:hypothetical protein
MVLWLRLKKDSVDHPANPGGGFSRGWRTVHLKIPNQSSTRLANSSRMLADDFKTAALGLGGRVGAGV